LDTNRPRINRARRAVIGLAVAAAVCVAVTNLYALFGHGVRSDAMDFMFLYPLCGAAAVLLLDFALRRLDRRELPRLALNLLNSGVAALTLGAMLRGILSIAGGSSTYMGTFPMVGWSLAAAGVIAAVAAPVLPSR
jgi:hypothetical protein